MQIITANCPACGGPYDGVFTSRFVTCEYCGTRFALSPEELKAMGFVDSDGDGYDDNDVTPEAAAAVDEGDAEPMDEFAAKACTKFLKSGVDRSSFVSSRKIERGLGLGGEEVYLIHDDTMFKSGKNGFAITAEGLYCREMGERNAHFTSWEDFGNGEEPYLDDSYVRQDDVSIAYFTDDSDVRDNQLIELYEKLYNNARRAF